jgi:hypothetical protein
VLGPATWQWVADALTARGRTVVVPDLRAAVAAGDPATFIDAAAAAVPAAAEPPLVVGHSGAGLLLPAIGAAVAAPPARLVFVDAGIPPCSGSTTVAGDFLDQLACLAVDGTLPPWSQWWDTDMLRALVPDEERAGLVEAELPEVPLAFFERLVDQPDGWCDAPSTYVLLSDGYRREADHARSLGWNVVERAGGHLAIVSRAAEVADLLHRAIPGSH